MKGATAILLLTLLVLTSGCTSNTYYVDDAIEHDSELLGKTVTLSGALEKMPCRCTMMACSEENPCCNSCSCGLALVGKKSTVFLQGEGCSGNDCEITCTLEPAVSSIITGVLEKTDEEYRLVIE